MNCEFEKKLGKNIRKLRESRHMSQEQLSAILQIYNCDITRSTLAKIEVGQRHSYPDKIFLFKALLNASYEDIFPDSIN